jgi:hypothetical protein
MLTLYFTDPMAPKICFFLSGIVVSNLNDVTQLFGASCLTSTRSI